MAIAGAAGGIAQLIKAGSQAGMKAIMPCVMKFTAGFVAGEVASRVIIGPAIERAIGGLAGNPVDLTTGRKIIPDEVDFSLPGLMPIEWSRFYASDLSVDRVASRDTIVAQATARPTATRSSSTPADSSATARSGESPRCDPAIATRSPRSCRRLTTAAFWSGSTSASTPNRAGTHA